MNETPPGGSEQSSLPPAVRFDNLHVAWDSSLILHGVSATIPPGQTVAITGANGSGKSTLMRAMMGNAPIVNGSIHLFGASLSSPRNIDWSRIGYVPQRFNSGGGISSTVEEVVRSGLLGKKRFCARPGDKARARDALERVGLAHRAKEPIQILSGGQQQRALIARALIRHPDLLIMDEPMAGIDAHSRQRLSQIIGDARAKGTTILLVLHELGELAHHLDLELHLRNGHIDYDGPVDNADSHPHSHAPHDHHPDHESAPIHPNVGEGSRQHHYSAASMNDIISGGGPT